MRRCSSTTHDTSQTKNNRLLPKRKVNLNSTKKYVLTRMRVEVRHVDEATPDGLKACIICGEELHLGKAGAALVDYGTFDVYHFKENGGQLTLPDPDEPGKESLSKAPRVQGFLCRQCLSKGPFAASVTLKQRKQALDDEYDRKIYGICYLQGRDWATVEELDKRVAEYAK